MPIDMFPRTIENRLKIGRYVPILRHQSARIEPRGDGMFAEWGEIIIWQKGINTLQYKGTLRPKRGRQKP